MHFSVANNSVTHGSVNGVPYVYTFSGIDSTKVYTGIHLKSARYNTQTGVWEQIADLPDSLGKIAAGASTVNNVIYIIGGYHVFSGGSEVSSSYVHRYDCETNTYLSDGALVPVPIDDQVQAVWRDSLIFVVTGWSNNGNVPDVQIYDPADDSWQVGTPTPNNNNYKSFGASGTIIGDTIYYNGGAAMGFNFASRGHLRKGVIDPTDPTQITWSIPHDNPGDKGYRMACTSHGDKVFWIGGSGVTYNYNGIAYNGSGGVDPLHRILTYDTGDTTWIEGLGAPHGVMDLRGIAQITPTSWIICGGMEAGQDVSNRVWLLEYDPILGSVQDFESERFISVYPNPTVDWLSVEIDRATSISIYDVTGNLVKTQMLSAGQRLDVRGLSSGTYYLETEDGAKARFMKQ